MFLELINYNVTKITIFLHGRREARHLSDNLGKWPASHRLCKSPHCLLPYIHVWNFEKDELEDLELEENVFQFYLKQACTWHVTAMGCWLLTGTGVAWCLLWGGGQTTSQPHDSAHLSSSVSSKGSHGWKQSHSDPSRSGSCPERKVGSMLGWVLGYSMEN